MDLNEAQERIVKADGNIVVTAGAGAGKTHTLVSKVFYDIEKNEDYRRVAAITFTKKAAQEIRNRMPNVVRGHFISTINSFVCQEIIPFFEDAFNITLQQGLQPEYKLQFSTREELWSYALTSGRIAKYADNKKNFLFEIASEIVRMSEACRLFLQAKYFKIYVDEYQDCDITMHNFFMYLCKELSINLVVVGDSKQSIYGWRGARKDSFNSLLSDDTFKHHRLDMNYRSCQQIQNFANLLYPEEMATLFKKCDVKDEVLFVNLGKEESCEVISKIIDFSETCALLRRTNAQAQELSVRMTSQGNEWKFIKTPPVSEIYTSDGWLYYELARYYVLSDITEYDILKTAPDEFQKDEISKGLRDILQKINKKDLDFLAVKYVVENVFALFDYVPEHENIASLIESVKNPVHHGGLHPTDYSHVTMTIHSSKGTAFDQIVIYGEDFDLEKQEEVELLYVAATRAKKKLIVVTGGTRTRFGRQYCAKLNASGHSWTEVLTLCNM